VNSYENMEKNEAIKFSQTELMGYITIHFFAYSLKRNPCPTISVDLEQAPSKKRGGKKMGIYTTQL